MRGARLVADAVHRRHGANSAFVHGLLRWLEEAGFDGSPRFLGVEGDDEVLTYIDGVVPVEGSPGDIPDWVWGDEALASAFRLIRRYQDLTASCPLTAGGGRSSAAAICPPGTRCTATDGPWPSSTGMGPAPDPGAAISATPSGASSAWASLRARARKRQSTNSRWPVTRMNWRAASRCSAPSPRSRTANGTGSWRVNRPGTTTSFVSSNTEPWPTSTTPASGYESIKRLWPPLSVSGPT